MVRPTDCSAMTIAVDSGRKATKQTNDLLEVNSHELSLMAVALRQFHPCHCSRLPALTFKNSTKNFCLLNESSATYVC